MASGRFIYPFPQAFEASTGNVGAGWQLYFYESGSSSILKNTFTDAALSAPHQNPVKADANGRWPEIFLEDGSYNVELYDTTGALKANADPINGSGSGGDGSGLYLGVFSEDPTVNNDGDPLSTGNMYFNSVTGMLRVYRTGGIGWSDVNGGIREIIVDSDLSASDAAKSLSNTFRGIRDEYIAAGVENTQYMTYIIRSENYTDPVELASRVQIEEPINNCTILFSSPLVNSDKGSIRLRGNEDEYFYGYDGVTEGVDNIPKLNADSYVNGSSKLVLPMEYQNNDPLQTGRSDSFSVGDILVIRGMLDPDTSVPLMKMLAIVESINASTNEITLDRGPDLLTDSDDVDRINEVSNLNVSLNDPMQFDRTYFEPDGTTPLVNTVFDSTIQTRIHILRGTQITVDTTEGDEYFTVGDTSVFERGDMVYLQDDQSEDDAIAPESVGFDSPFNRIPALVAQLDSGNNRIWFDRPIYQTLKTAFFGRVVKVKPIKNVKLIANNITYDSGIVATDECTFVLTGNGDGSPGPDFGLRTNDLFGAAGIGEWSWIQFGTANLVVTQSTATAVFNITLQGGKVSGAGHDPNNAGFWSLEVTFTGITITDPLRCYFTSSGTTYGKLTQVIGNLDAASGDAGGFLAIRDEGTAVLDASGFTADMTLTDTLVQFTDLSLATYVNPTEVTFNAASDVTGVINERNFYATQVDYGLNSHITIGRIEGHDIRRAQAARISSSMQCSARDSLIVGATDQDEGGVGYGATLYYSAYCRVKGNTISSTRHGILLQHVENCIVSDNVVTDDYISAIDIHGVGSFGNAIVDNIISATNRVENFAADNRSAIRIGNPSHPIADKVSLVANNTITGYRDSDDDGAGIAIIAPAVNYHITGNMIHDCAFGIRKEGNNSARVLFSMASGKVSITNNSMHNCGTPIDLTETTPASATYGIDEAIIVGNTFFDCDNRCTIDGVSRVIAINNPHIQSGGAISTNFVDVTNATSSYAPEPYGGSGTTVFSSSNNSVVAIESTDSDAYIEFSDHDTTTRPRIGVDNEDFIFEHNNFRVGRIRGSDSVFVYGQSNDATPHTEGDSSGTQNLAITAQGQLRVGTDAEPAARFNRHSSGGGIVEYFSSGVKQAGFDIDGSVIELEFLADGGGVKFSGTTTSGEEDSIRLDHYERGTATVTATSETSGTITLTDNELYFSRVGRQVTASGTISVASVSSPVGTYFDISLPIVSGNYGSAAGGGGGSVVHFNGATYATLPFIVAEGVAYARVYVDASTIAASDTFTISGIYHAGA